MAKKADIRLIDYLQKRYGFDDTFRRMLHDEMARMKGRGENLSRKEIENLIRDLLGYRR